MMLSYWGPVTFQGRTVKLSRGGKELNKNGCVFCWACIIITSRQTMLHSLKLTAPENRPKLLLFRKFMIETANFQGGLAVSFREGNP